MKKLIQKDKKKRILTYKYDNFRFILKNIIINKKLNSTVRWNAILKMFNLPINSFSVKIVNRCILTGRKSGINKSFKLSRLSLLRLSRLGQISGLKKSS